MSRSSSEVAERVAAAINYEGTGAVILPSRRTLAFHDGKTKPVQEGAYFADPMKPIFSIEEITPDMARELIQMRRTNARKNKTAVRLYAASMARGAWIMNGMPIILSKGHKLIDGFQRLLACIEADVPFTTLLAQNIDDNIVHTVDQQRKRSYVGVLQARGIEYPTAVFRGLVKLIRYDEGTLLKPQYNIGWAKQDRFLELNPEIHEAVQIAVNSGARMLHEATRVPLCFMGLRTNRDALMQFLDSFTNPENYQGDEPGRMIRARLESERGKLEKTAPVEMFAICLLALSDTITGKRRTFYRWVGKNVNPRTGQDFPQLEGYTGLRSPPDGDVPLGFGPSHPLSADEMRDFAGLHMSIENITPEVAEEYLQRNAVNRKIVQAHVDTLVRDIEAGNWMMNAQPICFGKSGNLLNGQHRLNAVIKSGLNIEVMVLHGVDDRAFDTYDIHARKPALIEDLPETMSASDENLIKATAKILWREEQGALQSITVKPSASEMRDVILRHPDLPAHRTYGRRAAKIALASILTYLSYRVMREDPTQGREFLEKLETGANMDARDPLLVLREQLLKARRSKRELDRTQVLLLLIDAWNNFRGAPLEFQDAINKDIKEATAMPKAKRSRKRKSADDAQGALI